MSGAKGTTGRQEAPEKMTGKLSVSSPAFGTPPEHLSDRNGSLHDFALKLKLVLWAEVCESHMRISGKVPNVSGPPSGPLGLTQPPSHAGLFASVESAFRGH